jgi:hypothetical protein
VPEPTPTPEPAPVVFTGIFLDSAVQNLNYATPTAVGKTNNKGEFEFMNNEQVIFSIGNIQFPAVAADTYITPLDIFSTGDVNHTSVVNMLRLLQSLDIDGDATNGIVIPDAAHDLAQSLSVDFSASDFDSQVENLVQMSGSINQQLIAAQDAVYHFEQTLAEVSSLQNNICDSTHAMVGQSGFFMTQAHNVAGMATVLNDCSIKITNFDYDGGGPRVYFYAANNDAYSDSTAFAISRRIEGQAYNGAEFILRLPTNRTLDDLDGLSVWCSDFNADFGHLTFTP